MPPSASHRSSSSGRLRPGDQIRCTHDPDRRGRQGRLADFRSIVVRVLPSVPNDLLPAETRRRFDRFCDVDDQGCWRWTGTLRSGRGQFKVDGRTVSAPQWIWQQERGDLPEGAWLNTECNHHDCVNPNHLVAVPPSSIVGVTQRSRTHCPAGHPYDDENTYVAPSGKRLCRTCRRS